MEKALLFFLFVFMSSLSVFSQSCLPEGITFLTQEAIDDFQTNYPGCSSIEGDVVIHGYDIDNLNGLSVLTGIGGILLIDSTKLADLQGLNSLTSIGKSLQISRNNYLDHLYGLTALTAVTGTIHVSFSGVENFLGMPQLTSIGGLSVYFTGTRNFQGLEGLTSINGPIMLKNGYELESLAGLENVQSINGSLSLIFTSLKSLSELENIDHHSISDISILGNDSLFECDVESICNYLAEPTGFVSISNNAAGCNNPEEILDACFLKINESPETGHRIIVYPNPAHDMITIKIVKKNTLIEIYNSNGSLIWHGNSDNDAAVDISGFAEGLYVVKLHNGKEESIEKFVKY